MAFMTVIRRLSDRLPSDIVGRTRSLFLTLSLVTTVLVVPPLLLPHPERSIWNLVVLALLTLLCWRWYRWFQIGQFAAYDPLIEVLALTALTWTLSEPSMALGVFYVGLYYRSLFGNRRQAMLGVITFAAAYFTGIGLHANSTNVLLTAPVISPVTGFILTGIVMYVIAQTLGAHRQTLKQLGDAEEQFRVLVEQLPIGIYRASSDGNLTYVSPQGRAIFGFDDSIAHSSTDWAIEHLVHEDDRDRLLAAWNFIRNCGDQTDVDFRMLNANGELRWVRVRSLLVKNSPDEVGYLQGTLEDVTDRREAAAAVHAAEERYRTLVEQIPAVTYISGHDGSGTPNYVSPQIEEMLGYPADDWVRDPALWIERLHPDDRERVLTAIREAIDQQHYSIEYRTMAADGRMVWVENIATLVCDRDGAPRYWHGVLLDVSARKQAEDMQRQLAAIVAHSHDAIIGTELGGKVTSWNRGAEEQFGYTATEMIGQPITRVMVPEEHDQGRRRGEHISKGGVIADIETVGLTKAGDRIDIALTLSPLVNEQGQVVGVSAISRDIRERKRLEADLLHQAFHDNLTGLANRALFNDRLAHALARSGAHERILAVLFLDIDNFKVINDSLGHEAGDELLKKVGKRFVAHLRSGDTASRLGGDEFTFLLEDLTQPEEAVEIAERLLAALQAPVAIGDQELLVTASVGVAVSSEQVKSSEDLLRHADVAMYHAKHQGKGRVEQYAPELEAQAWARLRMEQDLRRALERDELLLVYQPIMQLSGGNLFAVEALVRWDHPQEGLISPIDFIPLAEETGLILPLGKWVLETACRQMREWQADLPASAPKVLSVNLSVRQLQDPALVPLVASILEQTGLAPETLALEITESALMEASAVETIENLRRLGVLLGIDDFGTGYSSLAYLQRMPVDFVKIDRSFIDGLGRDANDTVITSGIIGLAHALKS